MSLNDIQRIAAEYARFLLFVGKASLRPGHEIERLSDTIEIKGAVQFYAFSLLTSVTVSILVVGFGHDQPLYLVSSLLIPAIGFLLFFMSAHYSYKLLGLNVKFNWLLKTSLLEVTLFTFVYNCINTIRSGYIKLLDIKKFNILTAYETDCAKMFDLSQYWILIINQSMTAPFMVSTIMIVLYYFYVEICVLDIFLRRHPMSAWKFSLLTLVGLLLAAVALVVFVIIASAITVRLCST